VAVTLFVASSAFADDAKEWTGEQPKENPPIASDTGFAASLHGGVVLPKGKLAQDLDMNLGSGIAIEGRAGYYFTPTLGVLAGIRYASGHTTEGCSVDCGGYSFQIPVVIEASFSRRTKGVFFEGGFALLPQIETSGNNARLKASSAVDAKVGLGYRTPIAIDAKEGRGFLLEGRVNYDVGSYNELEVEVAGRKVTGELPEGALAVHHMIAFSLGVGF
jgi:hypothetical protein